MYINLFSLLKISVKASFSFISFLNTGKVIFLISSTVIPSIHIANLFPSLNTIYFLPVKNLSNSFIFSIKLNDKISKLNEELRKQQDEIVKYNNEIAEKEQDYKFKYDELVNEIKSENSSKNLKISELVAKYGQNAVKNYKMSQINDILDGYFSNMTKEEILDILANNESLRQELGSDINTIIARYQ